MTNRTRPHTVTHISCRGERRWNVGRQERCHNESGECTRNVSFFKHKQNNKLLPNSDTAWKQLQPAQQAGVSHFILEHKRLQQRRAGPIPIRICRTVQHAPLRCVLWISLQAHTVGCGGHRDLLGNSPHYKPHPHNSVKVYDIIRPCHRRALQSEPKCTC